MIYGCKVILGALILSVQQIKRHPVAALGIVAIIIAGAHSSVGASTTIMPTRTLTEQVRIMQGHIATLQAQVTQLDHACIPRGTGGGVTQCVQVSVEDEAWRACLTNGAYIGVTQEDTLHLLRQCLDDWRGAHPHIHP